QPDPGAITPLRPPPNAAATRAPRSEPVPSWATIALVGAGTALGTLFVLWQTGAFSRAEPAPARWTDTGFVPPGPCAFFAASRAPRSGGAPRCERRTADPHWRRAAAARAGVACAPSAAPRRAETIRGRSGDDPPR